MVVVYAEKPDMGRKIAAALGNIKTDNGEIRFEELAAKEKLIKSLQHKNGYLTTTFNGKPCKVTWGYGHMCGLGEGEDYNPEYKQWRNLPVPFIPDRFIIKGAADKKQQLDIIKKLFEEANIIINATDYDREGEVIFAYIYEYLRCSTPYMRAHFTSQTKEGICEGFDRLLSSDEVRPIEMAGRARAIADWLVGANLTAQMSLKHDGGVLSIGRVQTPTLKLIVDKEIQIKNFKSTPFWQVAATFKTAHDEEYAGEHISKRFPVQRDAEAVMAKIQGQNGVVTSIASKQTKREAPALYSLSQLQMDANDEFGYTANEVLKCAQALYDGGYTTYPRTKSQYLNDDMLPVVQKVYEALESVPTYANWVKGRAGKIASRYFNNDKVDSHFAIIPTPVIPPDNLDERQRNVYDLIVKSVIRMSYPPAIVEITKVETTVCNEIFTSNGSTILEPGWLVVGKKTNEKFLPRLAEGEAVSGVYELKEGKTEPPKRYTDKTLIVAMRTAGKELKNDELRRILSDPSVEGIGTEATRAGILETLEKRQYIKRSKKTISATDKGIALLSLLPVQEIQSAELTARWEQRFSGIARGEESYDAFIEDIKRTTANWSRQIANMHIEAGSNEAAMETKLSGPGLACPICGAAVRKSDWGWSCSKYRETQCPFKISKEIAGKKLTDANAAALITKGKTLTINGFKSKAGNEFSAALKFDADYKVVFEFGEKKGGKSRGKSAGGSRSKMTKDEMFRKLGQF